MAISLHRSITNLDSINQLQNIMWIVPFHEMMENLVFMIWIHNKI